MNFCKDCLYFREYVLVGIPRSEYHRCAKDASFDPVTGDEKMSYCGINRSTDMFCGEEGKWFEPRVTLTPVQEALIAAQENSHE
mgnify:FL=1